MKPATFHAGAEEEIRAALSYYDLQREGLAGAFRRELDAALARVRQNPHLYAEEDGARLCPLGRFPYTLVYVELGDVIG